MAATKVVDARMPWWSLAVVGRHGSSPRKDFNFDPGIVRPHLTCSCLTSKVYDSGARKIFLQESVLLDHVLNLIPRILLIYK